MDWKTYTRTTEDKLRGTKVRLRVEMRLHGMVVPAGTVMTITGKHKGLRLDGEACGQCGIKPVIWKVNPLDVDVLTGPDASCTQYPQNCPRPTTCPIHREARERAPLFPGDVRHADGSPVDIWEPQTPAEAEDWAERDKRAQQ